MEFTPRIDDTLGNYQLQLLLRHNERYAYQNIWLFVEVRQDTLLLHSDTIECMLADERGVWYGKGMTRFTLPLLYKEDIAMPAGEYVVTVQQGMREETLQGITEVGLKVIENR
jgi:gliding motility-associated lipoprotein GldH